MKFWAFDFLTKLLIFVGTFLIWENAARIIQLKAQNGEDKNFRNFKTGHPEPMHISTTDKIVSTKESLDGEKAEPVQTEFACHKFILSLKSPVFRAMILAQKDSEVLTVDIDPISLSNLLCFLYKSEIPDNKIDEKLLLSSDKFRILDLKTKCLNSMIKKV